MVKRFRDALLEKLEQTGLSVAEVARGAGVSYEQLKKVRQRLDGSTNVDDAVRVAHYFGVSLDEFLNDSTIEDRNEMLDLYTKLSSQERAFLLDVARARASRAQQAD